MNELSDVERRVILDKSTEAPFTGEYLNNKAHGVYVCRQCDSLLYNSKDKFESFCGWPSFDDEIKDAVKRTLDKDGVRTEITCAKCGGHLGHVFNDGPKETTGQRFCINSCALDLDTKGE